MGLMSVKTKTPWKSNTEPISFIIFAFPCSLLPWDDKTHRDLFVSSTLGFCPSGKKIKQNKRFLIIIFTL